MAANAQSDEGIDVVGAEPHPLRDVYHSLLRMRWAGVLLVIALLFLIANAFFAAGYMLTGGIGGAHDHSFRDAYFFSVQTMGTVGYGAMYPTSTAANLLVVAESVTGVILTALATGVVFTRFSQTRGKLVFTSRACIAPMDGVPTLMLRIGNDRASTIVDAMVRVVMIRTEKTKEGVVFYRMLDIPLVRERAPALSRSWTVMHVIDEMSPLFGVTPESADVEELELSVSVVGTDDTSLQPVHGRHRYVTTAIRWGARPVDVLSELPNGRLQLDVRKFDEIAPTEPIEGFPYPTAV